MQPANGMMFSPEQTLFVKSVPKGRLKLLEEAIYRVTSAKAVNAVLDKDPLCPSSFLIYANYTSAGDAKRGQVCMPKEPCKRAKETCC